VLEIPSSLTIFGSFLFRKRLYRTWFSLTIDARDRLRLLARRGGSWLGLSSFDSADDCSCTAAMSLISCWTARAGPACWIIFTGAGCMFTGSTGAGPGCGSILPGPCCLSTCRLSAALIWSTRFLQMRRNAIQMTHCLIFTFKSNNCFIWHTVIVALLLID